MSTVRGSGQSRFARALIDPDLPLPCGLQAPGGEGLGRRFAVYRNNVIVSLIDALAARYPVTQRLVGEEFFRAMARVHARANPPRSPVMLLYGEDFPTFIESFPPAHQVPCLADVARLEAALTRAYHAADERCLGAADFAALDTRNPQSIHLRLHPSVGIIRSRFSIHSIWHAHAVDHDPIDINTLDPEDVLVARPRFEILVRPLRPGTATFLQTLAANRTIGDAASAAIDDSPDFDLSNAFSVIIADGLVTEYRAEKENS